MRLNQAKNLLKEKWKALTGAIEWRLRLRVGDNAFDDAIYQAGKRFRPILKGTDFFGVAGSVGKTTAKDFLVGILGVRGKCIGNPLSRNAAPELARTILRVRPWHHYCVAELGETGPGTLDKHLAALTPVVGLVTNIGDDHLSAFGSREAIAREFAKLAHILPPHGTLILNDDDEQVVALRHEANCRVISFGTTSRADLQASKIVSTWPEPLGFLASFNGETVYIRTRMHGRHLLTSALAAIGGGLAAGLSLNECARGIATVDAAEGRMQALDLPSGLSIIRDDFKAPAWTVRSLLAQLAEARARRKILILGSISDCQRKEEEIFKLACDALPVADITIFTGKMATAALKARNTANTGRLFAFSHPRDAHQFLESIRQEGDLIAIKGNNKLDHLSRIALSLAGRTVNCWVDDCGRDMFCSECSHLESHRGPPGSLATPPETGTAPPLAGTGDLVVIGLGNPGPEFAGTPHNVGYEALDALSALADSPWNEYGEAWIAAMPLAERRLWLIKLKSPMNRSGSALRHLSVEMGFDASHCILIFDDIDLPLGKVRSRMDGSSGGHRGVASILEAFQTDAFCRVKIGVRSPTQDKPAVLQRFDEAAYAIIRQAFPVVAERLRQLSASR